MMVWERGGMSGKPCERCDRHGPDEDTLLGDLDAVHRAWHDLGRVILSEAPSLASILVTVWLVTVGAALIHLAL
jgi:hypothetical protein